MVVFSAICPKNRIAMQQTEPDSKTTQEIRDS
jgi:hypothetical protein